MRLPWFFKWLLCLLVLTFSANIPFVGIGMYWGAPAILLISLWVSSTWNWYDPAIFMAMKTWFFGLFCIALVEILRQYPLMNEFGVEAYLKKIQFSIILALIPLTVASIFMPLTHKTLHGLDYLTRKIEKWIKKEQEKYHRTWIYRRYFKFSKKLRGLGWRIHNALLKASKFIRRKITQDTKDM